MPAQNSVVRITDRCYMTEILLLWPKIPNTKKQTCLTHTEKLHEQADIK